MPTEPKDEVVLPEEAETETPEETPEETEEAPEEVEPSESEKKLMEENKKLKSDNENYKKAVQAVKAKNKPKELPDTPKDEFVSKKEFYAESQNKAKAKARELYPELAKDEHWNEIIGEFYNPKVREGKTVEENTLINLENAALLWRAKQDKVDNSGKNETAKAAQSNTSPSKGDSSQPKKTDNTEEEEFYLDKFGLASK